MCFHVKPTIGLDLVFLDWMVSSKKKKKRKISSQFVNTEEEVGGLWVWTVSVPEIPLGMSVLAPCQPVCLLHERHVSQQRLSTELQLFHLTESSLQRAPTFILWSVGDRKGQ